MAKYAGGSELSSRYSNLVEKQGHLFPFKGHAIQDHNPGWIIGQEGALNIS